MNSIFARHIHWLYVIFFSWASALAADNLAKAVPWQILAEDPPLFPLDELKIGMQGTGYSVFSSQKGLEPFQFEVLGLMRGQLGAGQDLIIVRFTEARFQKSGIVAGMSGSPAYLKGKLLGAVSYGIGSFLTEGAIAGITPIQYMLSAMASPTDVNRLKSMAGLQVAQNHIAANLIKPIALPLVATGLSAQIAEQFKPRFESRGYAFFMPGAGGLKLKSEPAQNLLYAGGPIAVVLVEGPMTMAAIGTVTWVKKDLFSAFGHPFLETGNSSMPVASAEIVTTVFSENEAFKLGQPLEIIGALSDDRNVGIAGVMHQKARTVALQIKLGQKSWHYKIADHARDVPLFAAFALGNSLAMRTDKELGGSYVMQIKLVFADGRKITLQREISEYAVPLEGEVARVFLEAISALSLHNFKQLELDNIEVDLLYKKQVSTALLVAVDMGGDFNAGKKAKLNFSFRPWSAQIQSKFVEIGIPMGLTQGQYQFSVLDRALAVNFEEEAGISAVPQNYETLFLQIQTEPKETQVCIYLQQAFVSKRINGFPLVNLPPSLKQLTSRIAVPLGANLALSAVRLACVDMDFVMRGNVTGTITVKNEAKP